MELKDAIETLSRVKPATRMPAALKAISKLTPTKKDVTSAIEQVKEHLAANRHAPAVATVLTLLRWDADATIARLRKDSAFRASTYGYRSNGILKVVRAALEVAQDVNLSPARIQYLKSVEALQILAPHARQLRQALLMRLEHRKERVLKTLLVVVNEFFSREILANRAASSDEIQHWMPEEISEAFSSLLELFRTEINLRPTDWIHTDEAFVGPFESTYAALIVDAARLNTLREAETLIDGLPYLARAEGEDVVIESVDSELEKSIRLGYVQADQQTIVRVLQLTRVSRDQNWEVESLRQFADAWYDAGLSRFIYLETKPVRRLVFGLPDLPPLLQRLSSDLPFLQEVAGMYGAGLDAFNPDAGPALEVAPGLTALDVCKVQRLFLLVDTLFHRKLESIGDESERNLLRVRSTIPVTRRSDVLKMLGLALPAKKAELMLQFLTLSHDTKYVDLQYRPFIAAGDWFVYAPAVVGKSNLMRNIVTGNSLHTAMVPKDDPMERAVVDALTRAHFMVKRNFTFNINGKRETDIFAWREEALFVFECKNAFHPCNPHELRNSFDHIEKAEEQLDIRRAWLQTSENQSKIFDAMGWKVKPTKQIYTCVITANRAFSGYQIGAHPVRQAHEFMNVVLRGTVNRFDGQPAIRFWSGPEFQIVDLIEYLAGNSIMRTQHAALTPTTHRVRLGHKTLAFSTFVMNTELAAMGLDATFGSAQSM